MPPAPAEHLPRNHRHARVCCSRLDPAMHKRLRLLAVEEDTTVQRLGVEALEMLLRARR